MNIKQGQFVKVFEWNALILDVFDSRFGTDRSAIELHFAKDIARNKPAETHVLELDVILPGSRTEFLKEASVIRSVQADALTELLKKEGVS